MSKTVITAEGVGKSYTIGHQQKEAYSTLRDVLTNLPKNWWSRVRNPQYHTHENIEEFWALKDVDFDIKVHNRVGIIGRNGAGKSTLLKILSRITTPTTGKVKISGRVASLLEVGTGFHPELTGRENIYLNGAILGMVKAEIKMKFDEIVAFAEVDKFLDTPVKRYSSGMYVRLAFAIAAHLEPEILIVDEVLAVGDAQFQKKCLGRMNEVGNEGRTILFVSHNMHMVSSLCNKGIMLEAGKVKKIGDVADVISFYTKRSEANAESDFAIRKIGDSYVRLLSISVLCNDGKIVSRVSINQEVYIAIAFEVLQKSEREFVPRIDFSVEGGGCAFVSFSSSKVQNHKPGIYRAICHLPANFLNQGTYFLGVGMVSFLPTKILHFYEHGACSFDVIDPLIGVPTRTIGMPMNDFPGVVRPALDWEVKVLR